MYDQLSYFSFMLMLSAPFTFFSYTIIIFLIVKDMEVYEEKLRKALIQYLQLRIQHDSSFKVCVSVCFLFFCFFQPPLFWTSQRLLIDQNLHMSHISFLVLVHISRFVFLNISKTVNRPKSTYVTYILLVLVHISRFVFLNISKTVLLDQNLHISYHPNS